MKTFKWILIIFVALLVVLLAVGFFMPRQVIATTTAEISLPPQKVFHFVAGFVDRTAWDPWIKADTAVKCTFDIKPGYTGSVYSWEGPRIGKGMMVVDSVAQGSYLLNKVTFSKGTPIPEEWTFIPSEKGTTVTWTIKMTSASPLGRIMNSMFKGMILKTMESGRNDLRNYLEEHGVKLSTISEIGIEDFPSVEAFTCSGQGTTADISGFFASSYGKIYMEMGAQQIQPQGAPFALYTAFDQASGIFSVTAGIPVSSGGKTKGDVKLVKFREFKGLKGLHTGPYDEMNGSYQAVMDYAKENNIELTGVAWEFYLNNPAEISDPTLLQTQIVMEIKSK